MKGKRKTLDLAVKIPPEVIDHLLPNSDRRIIIEDTQPSQKNINDDQTSAGKPENALRGPGLSELPGYGCSGQDMVDDDFKRPRLEKFQGADKNDLCQTEDESRKVRPQVGTNRAHHQQGVLTAPLRMTFALGRNPVCALKILGHGRARVRDGIFGTRSRYREPD